MNSYYNVFVGTENGILKGINSKSKTFNNLNNIENLSKEKEIMAMCWVNDSNQDQIYFVTKDRHIVKYTCGHKVEAPFEDLGLFDFGNGEIKVIDNIYNDQIVSCTEGGVIKLWSITKDHDKKISKKILKEYLSGAHINCMKKSSHNEKSSLLVATGGKENDLKVWNLSLNSKEPVFRAKNVADNWIQLREPVNITAIDFIDQTKVVVGTAYHQIRVYDIKSGVRRPLFNLNFGQHPITSIAVLPNDSNRIIAANAYGEVQMLDVKISNYNKTNKTEQCLGLTKYKGFQGTTKSLQITNTPALSGNFTSNLCVATCGLDRFIRVHHVESGQLVSKVFLKSRLNCLLFSKLEPVSAKKANEKKADVDEDQLSEVNSEDIGTEDLWSDMDTVVDELSTAKVGRGKRRLGKRLSELDESDGDGDSDGDDDARRRRENDPDHAFLKPRPVRAAKKAKKAK